jgi:hypothetical protein
MNKCNRFLIASPPHGYWQRTLSLPGGLTIPIAVPGRMRDRRLSANLPSLVPLFARCSQTDGPEKGSRRDEME